MAKNQPCAGHLQKSPWALSWLLASFLEGSGVSPLTAEKWGRDRLARSPRQPDSGLLEAGLWVHADSGAPHELPGVSLHLICMGLPQHHPHFLGWGNFCRILPFPSWPSTLFPSIGHPGMVLVVLFRASGLCWSLTYHLFSPAL